MSEHDTKPKQVSTLLDSGLVDRLDKWIASQELKPTKRAVIERALSSYLDDKGAPA